MGAYLKHALRRWNLGLALKLLSLFLVYPTLAWFTINAVAAEDSLEGSARQPALHVLLGPLLIVNYGVVVIVLLFVIAVPVLAAGYRKRPHDLQLAFRRGMLLTSVLLAVVVPLEGLLLGLALCVATLEFWFWGLCLAAGAVGATIALVQAGLCNDPGVYQTFRAARIRLEDHPRLQAEMTDVAQELGIPLPPHVLLGLQPELRETTATVFCSEGELQGGALRLSLPASSILSVEEFRALVAEALVRLQSSLNENRAQFVSINEGANDIVKNLDQTMKNWSWWEPRILGVPYFILMWFGIVAVMRFPLYLGREWVMFYLRSGWISRQILDQDILLDSYRKSAQNVGAIPVLSALMKEAALTLMPDLHVKCKKEVPHALCGIAMRLSIEHPKMRLVPERSAWKDLSSAWEYLGFRCELAGKNLEWCLKLAEDVTPAKPAVWLFEDVAGLEGKILALLKKPFVIASSAGGNG
jgi:hypothetical protein